MISAFRRGIVLEGDGIDRKRFIVTFNSSTVQSKVNRANQIAAAYGITASPSSGIGGKYLVIVDPRKIGDADDFVAHVRDGK